MKETYYKLNREKLEEILPALARRLEYLIEDGVLEEVQEEEWIEQIKADAIESTLAAVHQDELNDEEIENRKLQEESKQAIDNMFGNPLGQIDSLVRRATAEEEAYIMSDKQKAQVESVKKHSNWLKYVEPKPFLDGMTPSAYHWKRVSEMLLEEVPLSSSQARHIAILEMFDLLVEELKKKNVIK